MVNALTIDVEEYFHPSELRRWVETENWNSLPSRVEKQTCEILDLLAERHILATFFILGWVAEARPHLVRRIAGGGHEIACHSYAHHLVYEMTPRRFAEDTLRAVRAIEDACGQSTHIYRAPSYSITSRSLWALEVLVECGFTHDSSIYPVSHDRYGIPGFGRFARELNTPSGNILEIPIATVQLPGGRVAPVGGGAYLRLLPYRYTAAGIRRINHEDREPACIYFHPWELDPDQPRLAKGLISGIRTYSGIRDMRKKMLRLTDDFQFSTIGSVYGRKGAVSTRALNPRHLCALESCR